MEDINHEIDGQEDCVYAVADEMKDDPLEHRSPRDLDFQKSPRIFLHFFLCYSAKAVIWSEVFHEACAGILGHRE